MCRHFGIGNDPNTPANIEIVRVVNDTRHESLRNRIPDQVFPCCNQRPDNAAWAYLRTNRDPTSAFREIGATMHDLDPNLPLTSFKTVEDQLNESLVTGRLIAPLSSVFGALATLLALIGVYRVTAHMVARRSREIGNGPRRRLHAHRPGLIAPRSIAALRGGTQRPGLPRARHPAARRRRLASRIPPRAPGRHLRSRQCAAGELTGFRTEVTRSSSTSTWYEPAFPAYVIFRPASSVISRAGGPNRFTSSA